MSVHDDNITLEDLDFAAEKGFNRGIEYVAVRMLKENMDIPLIAKLTGLPIRVIEVFALNKDMWFKVWLDD